MNLFTTHYSIDRLTGKLVYLGFAPALFNTERVKMLRDTAETVAQFDGKPIELLDVNYTLADLNELRNQIDSLLLAVPAEEIIANTEILGDETDWLSENPAALASVQQGLKESAEGNVVFRGSFQDATD
jgi:hypothetical protein